MKANLALLHGSGLDDFLVIGVAVYLLVMFALARLKTRQLKRRQPPGPPPAPTSEPGDSPE